MTWHEESWWSQLHEDWCGSPLFPRRPAADAPQPPGDRGWRSIGDIVAEVASEFVDDWSARLLRAKRDGKWPVVYAEYLNSEEWHDRREKVIERCDGVCEGCREQPVQEVHHLTYAHAGEEFLNELVGYCVDCHRRFHKKDHP